MRKFENFSVRMIQLEDKNLILQWRNLESVRKNMYTDHIIAQEEHDAWFAKALVNRTASHLVFSYKNKPVGFISFTNIDSSEQVCNWAFYLGESEVPNGTGAAMEYFALEYAFLNLGIKKLNCEVLSFNKPVIKLHERFGFVHVGVLSAHALKNGKYEDVICLAKYTDDWAKERDQFKRLCFK